jgi:hypothetical protein
MKSHKMFCITIDKNPKLRVRKYMNDMKNLQLLSALKDDELVILICDTDFYEEPRKTLGAKINGELKACTKLDLTDASELHDVTPVFYCEIKLPLITQFNDMNIPIPGDIDTKPYWCLLSDNSVNVFMLSENENKYCFVNIIASEEIAEIPENTLKGWYPFELMDGVF